MIKLRNLSKSYDKSIILDNISAEFPDNSSNVITGPSGSGKSTLLRLIAGLDSPDSGTVEIGGRCVSSDKLMIPPYVRGIGYVFQSPALWPHMTVKENITFGIHDVPQTEALERCSLLLDMMSVSELSERYPSKISGGEARRVALARALAPRPKILLLDEPLVNLNPDLKDEILPVLKKWQEETHCVLVYVTHDKSEADFFPENKFIMNGGRLSASHKDGRENVEDCP